MRKVVDVILIVVILGAVGFGVYKVGQAVTHESETGREKSAAITLGETPTTVTVKPEKPRPDTHDLQILVAKIVVAGVVALALLSTVTALFRHRRRERWHG